MEKTTIQISKGTLEILKGLKKYERESYDEVIRSIVEEVNEETLTSEEIKDIEISLKEIKEGKTRSIEEVAKSLGISLK